MDILRWLEERDAYMYYQSMLRSFIYRSEYDFVISEKVNWYDDNKSDYVDLVYRDYMIARLIVHSRSVFLIEFLDSDSNSNNDINFDPVQKKLFHEYNYTFELPAKRNKIGFILGSDRRYYFNNYLKSVKSKIDHGFDKYYSLLEEEDLLHNELGYLRISVNSYFSFSTLNELLEQYNKLYSLLFFIYKSDSIDDEVVLGTMDRLIIESIHLASDGFIVAVGSKLILDTLKELVSFVFSGLLSYEEYARRKELLEQEYEHNKFMNERHQTIDLILLLDKYISISDKCSNQALAYLKSEIEITVARIENLQGTKKIDVML